MVAFTLLTNTSTDRLVKAPFSTEGERGWPGGGRDTTVWASFSPAYDKVPSIHTHMPNEKKKSSNKSKQPNIEN